MTETTVLKYKDANRWFSLSFEEKPPAISLGIYAPIVSKLSELFRIHRNIPYLMQLFGFKTFEPDLQKGFGFDGAITFAEIKNRYHFLRMPLNRKHTVLALAVSIDTLLDVLECFPNLFPENHSADEFFFQLFTLEGSVRNEEGWHSAPLGGMASPIFVEWIEKMHLQNIDFSEEVERAMWISWNALATFRVKKQKRGPNPYPEFSMSYGENGKFILSCIGNACDVSTTDWWRRRKGEGHDLDCHNLDTPIQQLSLITGFAKLHDIASKNFDLKPLT